MIEVAPGWALDVERGPDWVFIRLAAPEDPLADVPPLAETLWSLLEQHFTYRLVLECDQVCFLNSTLIGQFVALHRKIKAHGGLMRLCGMSSNNQDVLHQCRLDGRFPNFRSRSQAVLGRPLQPR